MRLSSLLQCPKRILGRMLVLGCFLQLTAGCATLSRAKISISSSDETKPLTGPRWQ